MEVYKAHSKCTNGISCYFAAVNVPSFVISCEFRMDAFISTTGSLEEAMVPVCGTGQCSKARFSLTDGNTEVRGRQ